MCGIYCVYKQSRSCQLPFCASPIFHFEIGDFLFTCIYIIHVNQQDSGRLSIIIFPEPFEVAFVETSYTVFENVSTVEVCVNLTEPQIDILSENVSVTVFNDPNSVYIPAGGVLASKSLYLIIYNEPNCDLLQLLILLIFCLECTS